MSTLDQFETLFGPKFGQFSKFAEKVEIHLRFGEEIFPLASKNGNVRPSLMLIYARIPLCGLWREWEWQCKPRPTAKS